MTWAVEAIGFLRPRRDHRVEIGERRSTGAPDAQADTITARPPAATSRE